MFPIPSLTTTTPFTFFLNKTNYFDLNKKKKSKLPAAEATSFTTLTTFSGLKVSGPISPLSNEVEGSVLQSE